MPRVLPLLVCPGFPVVCPLCSSRAIDGELACTCLQEEENAILYDEGFPWEEYGHEWEEYAYPDYDAEYHAEDSRAFAYACWAAPAWEARFRDHFDDRHYHEEDEDYDAWVRAFPSLPWDASPTEHPWNQTPLVVETVSGPETAWWHSPPANQWGDPWEKWETIAEAAGF